MRNALYSSVDLPKCLGPGGLLHILCFSDEEPGTEGPRRISQQEIRDAFHDGWKVQQIEPIQLRFDFTTGWTAVQPRRPEGMAGDD